MFYNTTIIETTAIHNAAGPGGCRCNQFSRERGEVPSQFCQDFISYISEVEACDSGRLEAWKTSTRRSTVIALSGEAILRDSRLRAATESSSTNKSMRKRFSYAWNLTTGEKGLTILCRFSIEEDCSLLQRTTLCLP